MKITIYEGKAYFLAEAAVILALAEVLVGETENGTFCVPQCSVRIGQRVIHVTARKKKVGEQKVSYPKEDPNTTLEFSVTHLCQINNANNVPIWQRREG